MGSGLALQKRRFCLNRIVNEIIPARYAYRYYYRRTETPLPLLQPLPLLPLLPLLQLLMLLLPLLLLLVNTLLLILLLLRVS